MSPGESGTVCTGPEGGGRSVSPLVDGSGAGVGGTDWNLVCTGSDTDGTQASFSALDVEGHLRGEI